MKSFTIVAIFAAFTSSATAQSFDYSFIGSAEYSVESEVFETEIGVDFGLTDRIVVTPMLTFNNATNQTFDFAGAELSVNYQVNYNFDVYGRVEFDQDFDYNETVIGVSWQF
jgi:outer membrane cobalamin receptor